MTEYGRCEDLRRLVRCILDKILLQRLVRFAWRALFGGVASHEVLNTGCVPVSSLGLSQILKSFFLARQAFLDTPGQICSVVGDH